MNIREHAAEPSVPTCLPQPETLLADPDRLLHAREQLLAHGAHLHGPEIAQRLGVPEAAIMAARIGHGARRVEADLPRLLDPLPSWSKCLLAIRNRFGVALALGRYQAPEVHDQQWQIRSDQHAIAVGLNDACEAYWLEEHDSMHGRSVSLNVFDAAGDALLRVYLLSKEGQELALPHLHAHLARQQERNWQAIRNPGCRALTETLNRAPSMAADAAAKAASSLRHCLSALPRLAQVRVSLRSASSQLVSRSKLNQAHETPPSSHATGPGLKLHLRADAALTRAELVHDWGSELQWLALNGDSLGLAPGPATPRAEAQDWLDACLRGEHAIPHPEPQV